MYCKRPGRTKVVILPWPQLIWSDIWISLYLYDPCNFTVNCDYTINQLQSRSHYDIHSPIFLVLQATEVLQSRRQRCQHQSKKASLGFLSHRFTPSLQDYPLLQVCFYLYHWRRNTKELVFQYFSVTRWQNALSFIQTYSNFCRKVWIHYIEIRCISQGWLPINSLCKSQPEALRYFQF